MAKAAGNAQGPALDGRLDFTPSAILSRIRSTLTGWITTLTAVATVVFAGVSLGEYVKSPATVSESVVSMAQLGLFLLALGIALIVGAAGWASALRAAPQDGAFTSPEKDPLRFFPVDTAPALLDEYQNEVIRFNAARLRNDLPAMNEASFWADAHAKRLWDWLEAYRTREASKDFGKSSAAIGFGVLLTIAGVLGFADALRQMKSSLPENVIVQGPKTGTLTLTTAGKVDAGLKACAAKVLSGELVIPVTVMSVTTPSADEKKAGIGYLAEVVPPLSMKPGCTVQVYTVKGDDKTVRLAVPVEPTPAAVPETPAATKQAGQL